MNGKRRNGILNVPAQFKYSEQHEWVKVEHSHAVIGITEFAQAELGDIVFVELPMVGQSISLGQPFGSVESVKTVSELYSPLSGKVIRVNDSLQEAPDKINGSPYEDGWMIVVEMTNPEELGKLLSADTYRSTYSLE
jgi:glycine cleavage system H protein